MLRNFNKLPHVFSKITTQHDGKYIEGVLPIVGEDGQTLYEYLVSVDFAYILPKVNELEELIPHDIDRHLYPNDWSLCLGYPIMVLSNWINSNYDCFAFVKNMVLPYLANQHYFDRNGEWLVEGLDHDINGAIQYYAPIFGTSDPKLISYRLNNILHNRKYRPNDLCFCGSNRKYKNCHKKKPFLPDERKFIQHDYVRFREYLNN